MFAMLTLLIKPLIPDIHSDSKAQMTCCSYIVGLRRLLHRHSQTFPQCFPTHTLVCFARLIRQFLSHGSGNIIMRKLRNKKQTPEKCNALRKRGTLVRCMHMKIFRTCRSRRSLWGGTYTPPVRPVSAAVNLFVAFGSSRLHTSSKMKSNHVTNCVFQHILVFITVPFGHFPEFDALLRCGYC